MVFFKYHIYKSIFPFFFGWFSSYIFEFINQKNVLIITYLLFLRNNEYLQSTSTTPMRSFNAKLTALTAFLTAKFLFVWAFLIKIKRVFFFINYNSFFFVFFNQINIFILKLYKFLLLFLSSRKQKFYKLIHCFGLIWTCNII